MNILPFQINVPAEITLERPEGTLVQGRYGDRVMFTLADGRIMYVPPFVASKIQADGVAPGDRFQLCKTQVRNGNRRSIEWTVRRLDPSEPSAETPLERDLRASLESVAVNGNGNGHKDGLPPSAPAPTKLEHALKTAISKVVEMEVPAKRRAISKAPAPAVPAANMSVANNVRALKAK